MKSSELFKWKHYEAEIILLTEMWYIQYLPSCRITMCKFHIILKRKKPPRGSQLWSMVFG
jgi:hypothetical protein